MERESVLVVDPDPVFLRIVRQWLSSAELDVQSTEAADEALRMAIEHPYAVAVVTVEPDDQENAALLLRLADASPQTECILLSADPAACNLARLYELGNLFCHRAKPLADLGDLSVDIARAIDRTVLRKQNARLLLDLRDSREQQRALTAFLGRAEALAAVGELATDTAREAVSAMEALSSLASRLGMLKAADRTDGLEGAPLQEEMQRLAGDCRERLEGLLRFAERDKAGFRDTELRPVVEDAVGCMRHKLSAHGVTVKAKFEADLPPVHADPALLREALGHLIMNALHAMPSGGALALAVERDEAGGVKLTVRDTGSGMSREQAQRAFDPYFSTRTDGRATGLGLTVTRTIVHQHGGDIEIESATGRGTRVIVRLPAIDVAAQPAAAVPLAA